ncbi:MAG: hypothetical protein ACRDTC_22145 [Pseudonocardiaceae bacterium]
MGNRHFQLGTGGLAASVIGLVVLLGGGTATAVLVTTNSAILSSAVGRWEQPGNQPLSGFEVSPMILTISPDDRFAFSVAVNMNFPQMNFPEEASPAGVPDSGKFPGIGIHYDCRGTDRKSFHTLHHRRTVHQLQGQAFFGRQCHRHIIAERIDSGIDQADQGRCLT